MNLIYKYINSSTFKDWILVPKIQKELSESLRKSTEDFICKPNDRRNRDILRDRLNRMFRDDNVESYHIEEDRDNIIVNYILKVEQMARVVHLQL